MNIPLSEDVRSATVTVDRGPDDGLIENAARPLGRSQRRRRSL